MTMMALVPAAGRGTRLYPHTHTKPKTMVRIAGKPILGHILSSLGESDIGEVVLVVGGPLQEQVVDYAKAEFGDQFTFTFVEQDRADGLGHSVYQAEPTVRGDTVLIALGDMLFESGFQKFIEAHHQRRPVDGSLGVKRVADPEHYGVVETRADGAVRRLVEKPDRPPSDLAISGVYVIENTDALFDALGAMIAADDRGAGGEFQLTDALQRMIVNGCVLGTFPVENWYDCGRPETLLEANRVLLDRVDANELEGVTDAVVVPPVDIGEDVVVETSVVGPDVSVDDGVHIENSLVRNSIVGRYATLKDVNLERSIIGDNTTIEAEPNHLDIGDNSTIHL